MVGSIPGTVFADVGLSSHVGIHNRKKHPQHKLADEIRRIAREEEMSPTDVVREACRCYVILHDRRLNETK